MKAISLLVASAALGAAVVAVPVAIAGAIAGALGYRYWEHNEGTIPGLNKLGEHGQKLSDRSQALHHALSGSV